MAKIEKKPNVILMFVDDLGIGDISSFHPEGKIHTEHVDKLAEAGMRFYDSHACSALCTPSRYALLTGRYPWRSRLKSMVLPGDSDPLIEKERLTMAQLFQRNGYKTACVGKWHLGLEWTLKETISPDDYGEDKSIYDHFKYHTPDRQPVVNFLNWNPVHGLDIDYDQPITWGPNQYGFDYFFGLPASLDQPPFVYIENDRVLEKPDRVSGVTHLDRRGPSMQTMWERGPIAPHYKHEQVLDDMNDKVLELIDDYANQEEPFFIYYPTPAVHGPLIPNNKFRGKSGLNLYADVVLQVDDMVRQITEKLKEKGIFEDTIFIFTSDNGCSAVADYETLLKKGHDPSGGYRGKKFDIYEGGHRVPTIVCYPRLIERGSESHAMVCHSDFFATFAELLSEKLKENEAEDSVSNLSIWRGEKEQVREDAVFASGSGFLAIEQDGWKLEFCEDGGSSQRVEESVIKGERIKQEFELYYLPEDKKESKNLYVEYPQIVEKLREKMDKRFEEGRTSDGGKQKNYIPEESWVQINWKKE